MLWIFKCCILTKWNCKCLLNMWKLGDLHLEWHHLKHSCRSLRLYSPHKQRLCQYSHFLPFNLSIGGGSSGWSRLLRNDHRTGLITGFIVLKVLLALGQCNFKSQICLPCKHEKAVQYLEEVYLSRGQLPRQLANQFLPYWYVRIEYQTGVWRERPFSKVLKPERNSYRTHSLKLKPYYQILRVKLNSSVCNHKDPVFIVLTVWKKSYFGDKFTETFNKVPIL